MDELARNPAPGPDPAPTNPADATPSAGLRPSFAEVVEVWRAAGAAALDVLLAWKSLLGSDLQVARLALVRLLWLLPVLVLTVCALGVGVQILAWSVLAAWLPAPWAALGLVLIDALLVLLTLRMIRAAWRELWLPRLRAALQAARHTTEPNSPQEPAP